MKYDPQSKQKRVLKGRNERKWNFERGIRGLNCQKAKLKSMQHILRVITHYSSEESLKLEA
jgi:hypothetical protein